MIKVWLLLIAVSGGPVESAYHKLTVPGIMTEADCHKLASEAFGINTFLGTKFVPEHKCVPYLAGSQ